MDEPKKVHHGVVKLQCEDYHGLMAEVSRLITEGGFRIVSASGDIVPSGDWMMRTEIEGDFTSAEYERQIQKLTDALNGSLTKCRNIVVMGRSSRVKADVKPIRAVPEEKFLLDAETARLFHPHDQPQRAFDAFLAYSDGKSVIHTDQLMKLLVNCGLETTYAHTHRLMAVVGDEDTVNFQQFFILFHALDVFKSVVHSADMDKPTSGITPGLLKARLRAAGLSCSEEVATSMVETAGCEKEMPPIIHFYEFLKLYFAQQEIKERIPPDVDFLSTWYMNLRRPKSRPEVTWAEEMVAGTVGGVAICLVGHPFDTIKVRLQGSPPGWFTGGMDCAMQTLRKEGFFALYKGMGGPLTTIPFINAIVFTTYGQAKSVIGTEDEDLSVPEIALCGAWAGLCGSVIVSPIEMIKSRLQLQFSKKAFLGPWDCTRKVYEAKGIRGIFKGMSATIYRETAGYAGQFGVYEGLKRVMTPEGSATSAPAMLLAGGMSGIGAWLCSYPMDYIKTQLQTEDIMTRRPLYKKHPFLFDGGFFDCGRQIVQKHGWGRLWLGIGPCLGRAFPANAAGFYAYEASLDILQTSGYFSK